MKGLTVYETSDFTQQVESAITILESSDRHLTDDARQRLYVLCKKLDVSFDAFEVSDLDEFKALIKAIQKQVVLDNNQILSTASIRDLSSLTGAITSLLRLFTASQKTIDYTREIEELFSAVMASISELTEEQQKPFWSELKNPKWNIANITKTTGGISNG